MARQATKFDPRTLEIKTKSIERTLVPLVSQVEHVVFVFSLTFLFRSNENLNSYFHFDLDHHFVGKCSPHTACCNIVGYVGFCVQAAVERFVTVGESIADEHVEIQPEMYDACQEARSAGKAND
ncbi:conserved hypothetical protein [Trichinella spiralis]|uniref:hypothetical protein n=1 Tax=Trichinella spiralis TaxID=6334 RepID=UPI0001EFE690|nr:conserved hypothetical protein [Trichinella spiralis]